MEFRDRRLLKRGCEASDLRMRGVVHKAIYWRWLKWAEGVDDLSWCLVRRWPGRKGSWVGP